VNDSSRAKDAWSSTELVFELVWVEAAPNHIGAIANGWPRLAGPDGKRTRRSAPARQPRVGCCRRSRSMLHTVSKGMANEGEPEAG
jgi:hypothetical protein